jgi:hypothetical protein
MKKNKIFPLIIIVSAILGLIVSIFLLFSYEGINIFSLTGNSIKNIGSSSSSESNSGFDDFTELKDYNDAIIKNNDKTSPSSSGGGGGSSSGGGSSGGSSSSNSDYEAINDDYTDSDENNEESLIEQSYS